MEAGSKDEVTSGEEKRSLPVQQKRQDWDLNEMQIEGISHRTKNNWFIQGSPESTGPGPTKFRKSLTNFDRSVPEQSVDPYLRVKLTAFETTGA